MTKVQTTVDSENTKARQKVEMLFMGDWYASSDTQGKKYTCIGGVRTLAKIRSFAIEIVQGVGLDASRIEFARNRDDPKKYDMRMFRGDLERVKSAVFESAVRSRAETLAAPQTPQPAQSAGRLSAPSHP
jgi:hypothetical protein